ncbi:MAG: RNA polymerase factor sigma-54 [Alphaproteobacteria bacterium]|nr:RNA polymerase factor sigma-54 [Alphaproteobacteria bacterium]MCD8526509.1 RNA polymerase factor sigma-54 [Alphaproteobacteria bacterium]MCD8570351.1 RNA polymerase factor sigma-54 [Alphaproteobacteria bacterium]
MTPQLQQAIKLLQLSNIELAEFIEEEIAQNPLLEKDERSPDDAPDDTAEASSSDEKDSMDDAFDSAYEDEAPAGSQDFDAGVATIGAGGNSKFEDDDEGFESRLETEKTLREHLQEQLFVSCEDGRDRMIGGLLIDMLDEGGYLRGGHEELAEQLGCSLERLERILDILKGFDPTGVFAADLAECLALQLDERGALDEPMQLLLDNLSLLGQHDLKKLETVCGVNSAYLADMVEEIRSLNPRPAAEFDHLVVQTAIPDVLMKRLPKNLGGGWKVELNTDTLPRVLVNNEYYTTVLNAAKGKEDREYITTQMQNASWLVRAMDQRAQTILKVASEIIEQQEAFFTFGIEFLRPLKLADIAEEIGMHESTVSRVTTGKYIGTPRGIFELKYFFSTALGGEDGGMAHSAEAVKARIKNLIDAEDPKKILSDDKIVDHLQKEGIDIARRTVAKYRESMNIGSSTQRRRQKAHK